MDPAGSDVKVDGNIIPNADDGGSLGSANNNWSDAYLADAAALNFGDDQDVSLTHVADTGLLLNAARKLQFGDAGTFIHQSGDGVLTIESDTTVDINGAVVFNGALTGITTATASGVITAGGLTVGSAVLAEAELEMIDGITAGTVLASKAVVVDANKDAASFRNLTATGAVTAGSFVIGSADISEAELEMIDGITAGTAAASKAVVLDASKNIATIGTVGCGAITSTGNSAMAQLTTSGRVIVDDATEATTATDGSLQTDGGLSVAKSAVVGDDLDLLSDAAILNFGADKDVNLTHVADNGLLLNSTRYLSFQDAGTKIWSSNDGQLDLASDGGGAAAVNIAASAGGITLDAEADIVLDANGADIILKDGGVQWGNLSKAATGLQLSAIGANKEVTFADGFTSGEGMTAGVIPLAVTGDYTTYISNFSSQMSIIGALNELAEGGTRSKFQYVVTGSGIPANHATTIDANLNHDLGKDPGKLDVFLNGQMMLSGTSAANGDYYTHGAMACAAAADAVQFFFSLSADDVVTVIKP